MNRKELVEQMLTYLNKLRDLAVSNRRNSAYIKGVRDAMKVVQAFAEMPEPTEESAPQEAAAEESAE